MMLLKSLSKFLEAERKQSATIKLLYTLHRLGIGEAPYKAPLNPRRPPK